MKKIMTLLMALTMCAAIHAQEIEKLDKFPSGYINGVFMGEAKFKTIDGVLYAVGYEGTKDWILVRYPAGSRNTSYTIHPYCRRIARGAFQGAAYLKEIYIPSTVSYIGDDAFAGCTSLQGIVMLKMPRRWPVTTSLVVLVHPPTRGYRSSSTPTLPRVRSLKTDHQRNTHTYKSGLLFRTNTIY